MHAICERIITAIDDTGYVRTHLSDLAIALNTDLTEMKKGLAVVQSFDPPGIGARDLRECLLLQLERQGDKGSLAYQLVDKHLEAVGRNQIPQIAKDLRISPSHVYELLERIRRLNPFPGSALSDQTADYVYPEVFIEKDEEGQWIVRSNRDYLPRVRISPFYLKMLKDPNAPKEAKAYIREKLNSSKLLMRALDQRRSTIERIGEALVEFQEDFFENGVEHMRPLIMSQVADRIGVHETTVSRAISNKYVQTPHGLFKFRHFFSTGYRGEDGEQVSSLGIKQKIQALVDAEDSRKPLSDSKLATMLSEQGFQVARRTVAKYREELSIPPSHMRRSY
jgi:RNA polymerase sigma-54 factor